jgi:hypothetical protein
MPRIVAVRAMSSVHARLRRVRLVPLLGVCLALGAGVRTASAATAPLGPDVWSMQLDGGVFAPMEASGASPTAGMRYGKHFSPHLQGGLLTGWSFKRAKQEAAVGTATGPEQQVELGRTEANLVPIMGYVQVDFTARLVLVPFAGFGVGYEWLALHHVDNLTGQQAKLTYANLAWQTYAGIGLRFATIWRLNSELYYNGGSLERKGPAPDGGLQHEAVHVNGVGARVGLDMLFD